MNQNANISAADILNEYTADKLSDIFYRYGELKNSRKIAASIVKFRESQKIKKTDEFLSILEPYTRRDKEKKVLAQAFQALRIEVNKEMDTLTDMLRQALQVMKPEGRISVISYHSLEDRLVKNFFKTGNFEGRLEKDFYGNPLTPFRLVNRKVIVPSDEEQKANPRSRSAKLRIAEKLLFDKI
jgi:16S rRNA (cytosine1402-N4)-methyltransferase